MSAQRRCASTLGIRMCECKLASERSTRRSMVEGRADNVVQTRVDIWKWLIKVLIYDTSNQRLN